MYEQNNFDWNHPITLSKCEKAGFGYLSSADVTLTPSTNYDLKCNYFKN